MAILLDTNVISETFKPRPEPAVASWLISIPIDQLFVSSITKAELLYGIALLPDGKRKQALADVVQEFLENRLANAIASFDEYDAVAYARISAHRRRLGRKIREFDAQIAAIATTRGFSVATRNVSDFTDCGI